MTTVGLIGCGKMANSHANMLLKIPDVKISAICDTDEAKCRALAEKTGAKIYARYEEMLENEKFDLVLINLPPALHGVCARYCAEKKTNVFIEKPMGLNSEDCKSIISTCEKNGVMLWIGHMQRYSKENRIAKELINSGKYGSLIAISEVRTCSYPSAQSPEWLMDKAVSGGGIMYNLGSHTLDMAKYFAESDVENTACSLHLSNGATEDAASGFVRFKNGISLTFNLMGRCQVPRYEIVLYLTDGEIRIKPRNSISACGRDGKFKEISNNASKTDEKETWQYLQLLDVIQSLKSGKPKVSGLYGMQIIEDIEKLYASDGCEFKEETK